MLCLNKNHSTVVTPILYKIVIIIINVSYKMCMIIWNIYVCIIIIFIIIIFIIIETFIATV